MLQNIVRKTCKLRPTLLQLMSTNNIQLSVVQVAFEIVYNEYRGIMGTAEI